MSEYIEVIIKKPLYGTFVYIRETFVNKAIKTGKVLRVTIPQGVAIVDPVDLKTNGKRMEKVFLRPDQPMVLYGKSLYITDSS